ncbi:[FeFe] hydrogenase H-cluster radical SAM maturase HydE [Oceanirhabdus sp. W0125-5]|uniref:[FeFe] hydrogenase H-cluster radical SAM maturase HydE n=1 Tax=Oceanirhabdus sp. W0125-5 TaxID=2999116 RepID=UPI0022F31500|nr:[FeFe] hydrogenase H-cluster radical SAM maturase HydE [Oceanirhabdus sp. W0125-5]WBW98411.1 [FeFe] hydrogenase H-cluster radical SAM maturase HydE [Oceanirhabdus sp. W0125-5]
MKKILDKLITTHELTKDELVYVLDNLNDEWREYIFKHSKEAKERHYGKTVYMRGLIEISNYCKQNCNYCGIRRDNKNVDRYRLNPDIILQCADLGYKLGYRTFVLQGGEDNYYTDELLVELIKNIKAKYPDSAITLSLGERSYDSYKKLYEAGADRYLLRHETATREIYDSLHPGMSYDNRRECLKQLKEIGFQTGAGFMVGLPNQDNSALADDLLFLKELKPHMIGIGPFIPHPETPVGECKGGTVEDTMVMLALTRLLLPDVLLPSTTALGTLDSKGREKALSVGANVVMPNLSPVSVREKYELYKDKICTGDEAAHCRKCIEGRINSVGCVVDMGRGDHASMQ